VSRKKISVIGAGNVGAATAHIVALKNLGDVVLLDIVQGLSEGKALDMSEAAGVEAFFGAVRGTRDWKDTIDSDIVIITSGLARKPGMSRDDLLAMNTRIVQSVSEQVARFSPQAIVIIVSNPLDAMVHVAGRVTGFPKQRVMGMAGVLDSARFAFFISESLGVHIGDVQGVLMGGHGDDMVPLPRYTSISGIPLVELMDQATLDRLIERARKGGIEIVNLMGSSAYYAPAAGAVKMAEAILNDARSLMSCCSWCDGPYGVQGAFVGVPVILGSSGVEKVVELRLSEDEKKSFAESVAHVRELVVKVDSILDHPTRT
jgi:malate dehydrogenase